MDPLQVGRTAPFVQRQPIVAAALLPTLAPTAEFVVAALLPSVEELLTPVAGAAPMAVVPVEGVVLTLLPGVTGPDNVPEALPVTVPVEVVLATLPVVFVLATLPVDGAAGARLEVPVLPGVDEPSVEDDPVVEPHGAFTPGLTFWANAPPAHAATAPATNSRASDLMMGSPSGE